jgi:inhibitor of growth protein 3
VKTTPLTSMPRDDLSIDFVGRNMPPAEHQDCAAVLEEWANRTANLPAEIAFMQEEIAEKDRQMNECLQVINKNDAAIQKWIKINGSHVLNPKEESHRKAVLENYDKAAILQEEKVALSQKTQSVIDKHTRWLDVHIKALQDRGEFPDDLDLPSTLRPLPSERAVRAEVTAPVMPLGPIANSATVVHQRLPIQHPARMLPTQTQPHHPSGVTASAPTTPAAAMMLNRQTRESSLGAAAAAANKRQRLTGGLGSLPANSSGLARHSSLTPATPRAGTPTTARAGSAQPRVSQKTTTGNKKVAPQGSRQSGVPRKSKPIKSGLGRLKRTGNKNSPSSTNDSELSDAQSGSGEEDDEAVTPPPTGRDAEGDEDMADVDDEEGGDDRKYCVCQSVSYGDMVACDNEQCPYEWFHWTCVGLKSEPVGTWICPVCTKNNKK